MAINYATRTADTLAELKGIPGVAGVASQFRTLGYHAANDGGGTVYVWDSTSTEVDNGGTIIQCIIGGNPVTTGRWKIPISGAINVKWFGAKGDDNSALYATNYTTDVNLQVTITQQTFDAICINKALRNIENIGGGKLFFPKGIYRIYGYLERLDFRITIDSEDGAILKSTDNAPTNTNGYGIFCVQPGSPTDITINGLILDGNADVRTQPTSEWRLYPLAVYGQPRLTLSNMTIKNSPIDCLTINYTNNISDCFCTGTNLFISNSYRNTMSVITGYNQSYSNCTIEKGGQVYGGTNPRYCLDLEPNLATQLYKNVRFNNCTFRDAKNVLVAGVWSQAIFDGCTFDGYGSTVAGYPWLGDFTAGQYDLNNCIFKGSSTYNNFLRLGNLIDSGEYAKTQYTALKGCTFVGCGLAGYGMNMWMENVTFMNSRYPVLLRGTSGKQQAVVRNMKLINVVDTDNAGTGATASFAVLSEYTGYLEISGLTVRIDPDAFPSDQSFVPTNTSNPVYGVHINPTLTGADAKISNVHVTGYYQDYPTKFSLTHDTSKYRDWGLPSSAPADTPGNILPKTYKFYRNCTMGGDYPTDDYSASITSQSNRATRITTTNATATTALSLIMPDNACQEWTVRVSARDSATGKVGFFRRWGAYRRDSGTTTLISQQDIITPTLDSELNGISCVFDVVTPNGRIRVTGLASTTIVWTIISEFNPVL